MDLLNTFKRNRLAQAGAALSLLAAVALATGVNSKAAYSQPGETSLVRTADVTISARGRATLVPRDSRPLAAHVDAEVVEIPVQLGAEVHAGDVLLVLRSQPALQALATARQQHALAVAEHTALVQGIAKEQLEREAAVLRANTAVAAARLERDAYARLVQRGVSSRIETERAELEYQLKESEAKLAEQLRDGARASVDLQVRASEQKVAVAQSALDAAQADVDRLNVVSPIDGRVAKLDVVVGQRAAPAAALAEVISDALDAEIEILDTDAAHVAVGNPIILRGGGLTLTGQIQAMAPQAVAGIVKVRATLTGPIPSGLRSQSTLEGELPLRTMKDATIVRAPRSSAPETSSVVQVVTSDGQLRDRTVSFGARVGEDIVVRDGLVAGERVVLIAAGS